MRQKPILTIGIPAYNVESYIEETVLSITKSKFQDLLEVLIVNDGSSDRTLEIANDLSKKYPCIKVINKPNGGHGSAINAAIHNATGKYFRLLDGDDWFNTAEFDIFIEKLKKENNDIIFTDLIECFIKSNLNRPVSYYSHLSPFVSLQLDDTEFPEWGPMLPTTTIKTSLLKKFGLKIDEKCFYVDQEYNIACYLSARTAIYYPCMIYRYRLEREGQSMEKKSLIKNVKSHEKVCKRLLSIYQKHLKGMSNIRQQYLSKRVIIPMCHMQYMIAIEWCKSRKHFLSFDNILQKYPNFYHNPGIAGTLTNFHRKTKGLFIKIDPFLRKIAEKKHQPTSKQKLKHKILVALCCLVPIIIANAIIINHVNTEQTIYFWDTSAYWKNSINLLDTFNQSKTAGFSTILKSLNTDYNLLPITPLIPFLGIFGTSRLSFILLIFNLYIIPFAFFMTCAIKTIFIKHKIHIKSWLYPFVFSVFLLAPAIILPILNGRPDAICLLIISIIIYFLAKTRLNYISNYFVLGILTFILIVLRRYFCFWAISLYAAIFITKTISYYYKYSFNKKSLTKIAKTGIKLCISGLIVIFLMIIFCQNLLIRYLTGGYSDSYSAYKMGSTFDQIASFTQYYGFIFLALVVCGIITVYIKYRKTAISELSNIALICSILTFISFTHVQTLGDQHMYMFIPFFTFFVAILMIKLHTLSNTKKALAIIPSITITCLSIYSFCQIYYSNPSIINSLTGLAENMHPVIRNDLDSMQKLSQDLSDIMSPEDYVYILSSSSLFNDDLLKNLNLPLYPNYNISNVLHVDKRDGFPNYFFDANYIVVADPIQTHLTKGSQDIISYLAEQILSNKATNLKQIKTYSLDNNVMLKLYHKESKYSDDFLKKTKTYFKDKYPSYPFLYENIPEVD